MKRKNGKPHVVLAQPTAETPEGPAQKPVNPDAARWGALLDEFEAEKGGVLKRLFDLKAFAALLEAYAASPSYPESDDFAAIADLFRRMVEALEEDLERVIERNVSEIEAAQARATA